MTWLALGAAVFCGLTIFALAAELVADWIIRQIGGKVGQ